MIDATSSVNVRERLEAARRAARALAVTTGAQREAALEAIAVALERDSAAILDANQRDIEAGREKGLTEGLLDRLTLTADRITALSAAVRDIAVLSDPLGQIVRGSTLANGMRIEQVRVPFGVVGAIYEARPNVTVDIAALALRSGNAVVLRGGSAALASNTQLAATLRSALTGTDVPVDCIQTVDEFGRDGASELMRSRGLVDVLIPRGSAALIDTVVSESTVPVIETGAGVVHVYVDADADVSMAIDIVLNAKTHRPSVCNAAETVLIHREAVSLVLPALLDALGEAGVSVHGDAEVQKFSADVEPAAADEWTTEHLDLTLGLRIVGTFDEALDHIEAYSTHHTESIVTNNVRNSERFLAEVDSAVVMVNASTRFTDGGVFGFGAEVGISTQKLHARGPMGLTELTSTKWLVRGDGQVRA